MIVTSVFNWPVLLIIIGAFLLNLFFKYCCMRCNSNVCLVGKTAVVTGGSLGIGHEIVLSLLSRGCKVIVADKVITENVKKSIIQKTKSSNFVLELVDFASFKSVRNFVEKLKKTEAKIDILVNNVGIGRCGDDPTEDGLNVLMQINYFSPFLLTHLLIDLLKKSEEPKILFTASFLSFFPENCVKSITDDNIIISNNPTAYLASKFFTVVASDIFAKKLRKHNIMCNSYHPGLIIRTNIFKESRKYGTLNILDVVGLFLLEVGVFIIGQSPRDASQTAVNVVVSEEYKNVTGEFVGVTSIKPWGSHDEVLSNKIWNASETLVKLQPNEKL
ncbi:retinol dehydrogenase 13 isoform X1 [Diabrotica virgifera virgifera]|uniref:Retinol dehydrogenase 11-like n=1 Tax=Diabrotica virgifera virgifera TaxID=50390 RepID=A0ABM5IMQ3_DIAVI|nr:retinol dehydrogenase 13 isoform X1 [Diabrotica virgifera virgifera]